MSRYFVTGGAGFIGSHLVDRLVETGTVTVYDDLSSGREDFISHHQGRDGFRLVRADLLDLAALREAIAGHDMVFHLAANPDARAGIARTDLDLNQGTVATYNVLDSMRVHGIRRLVFASSSTVYGEAPGMTLTEDHGPMLPISLYGASKLASEALVTAFCHLFGMQAWVYRFGNVVGGRATHGVILDFVEKLRQTPDELEVLGDGQQRKPYLLVGDCVDGMLYGLEHASETVNVFHLGSDSTTSVSDIARMLLDEMGLPQVKVTYTGGERGWPGDVPQVRFDVSRLEGLGWKSPHTSDEAVRIAIRQILDEVAVR